MTGPFGGNGDAGQYRREVADNRTSEGENPVPSHSPPPAHGPFAPVAYAPDPYAPVAQAPHPYAPHPYAPHPYAPDPYERPGYPPPSYLPPSYPPPSYMSGAVVAPPPGNKSRRKLYALVGAAAVLVVAGGATALVLSTGGGSGAPKGMNNVTQLEQSVKESYQARLDANGVNGTITRVTCVPKATPHVFQCIVTDQFGDTAGHEVQVTPNGDDWVTNN